MKIGVVADSHGSLDRLGAVLENLRRAGVTHLLHAGDFLVPGIAELLGKFPEVRVWIARGNCDVNGELAAKVAALPSVQKFAEVVALELDGLRIGASHIEGVALGAGVTADIFCHGHTHRAKVERRDNRLIVNPGALCDDGKYLILDTERATLTPFLFNEEILEK